MRDMSPQPQINVLPSQTMCCHPATPCPAVSRIEVDSALTADGHLTLQYRIFTQPLAILLAPPHPPGAADNLWQHTCCEAFIAAVNQPEYREFNFSPSRQWAAYRFTAYRQRDTSFSPPTHPQVSLRCLHDRIVLDAVLDKSLLPAGPTLQIGLSTVIEAADGSKSYWALRHCTAQPDFHHCQSFALTLNTAPP